MRLRRLESEFEGAVRVEWKSFLLRPDPQPVRDLERFREYTRSWARPAADSDAGTFREWSTDAGPPSHSIPPHLVAKAAASLGDDAFHAVHERLLRAYFAENRDISDDETLRAIWRDAGLPDERFALRDDPALLRSVIDDHEEAVALGVNGVPAVRLADDDAAALGAQPLEVYRRWFARSIGSRD